MLFIGTMRILIVEDEQPLRSGLEDLLAAAGHEVAAVADGRAALDTGLATPFDLVVLDLMLPGVDGIEVCRRLRQARPEIGVLMLTARGAEDDKVAGFAAGADDYLAKPFAFAELVARLRALGRRPPALVDEICTFGDLEVNLRTHDARRGDSIPLTAMEWRLLEFFVRHAGAVVDRAAITAYVWDENHDPLSNMLEVLVSRLRRKIDDGRAPALIETIRGAGYRFGS